jgi:ParB family transcriptional regulator, chromosome partitioning protein
MEMRNLRELKVTNPYLRLGSDVTELEKSIKTVGLIAPLVISKDNTILAGGRRYQALLNLGMTQAPVLVVDKEQLEMELISIDENLVRKDLNKQEIEGHLSRAKEIYQALHPEDNNPTQTPEEKSETSAKNQKLPSEPFLNMVSEKTGLSPRQIHQAISRDEQACKEVKEARRKGELSISQTNEIVKLKKEEQQKAINNLKHRPVREIKKIVKLAQTKGIDQALKESPDEPHAREFQQIDMLLSKLHRQLKQLEIEGIELEDLPEPTQRLWNNLLGLYRQPPIEALQTQQISH